MTRQETKIELKRAQTKEEYKNAMFNFFRNQPYYKAKAEYPSIPKEDSSKIFDGKLL
jgi:hypothetical protein